MYWLTHARLMSLSEPTTHRVYMNHRKECIPSILRMLARPNRLRTGSLQDENKAQQVSPTVASAQSASQGATLMFTAAVLWGSNPVALRFVALSGAAPGPAVLTILHAGLAGVLLTCVLALSPEDAPPKQQQPLPPTQILAPTSLASYLNYVAPSLRMAALELGILAAVANAFTVIGFQNSSATHGAFLFRLSAAATPVVAWLAGDSLQPLVWLATALALVGSLLLALDPDPSAMVSSSAAATRGLWQYISGGDAALITAALLWSLQIVRVGRYTKAYPPLELAAQQLLYTAVASLPLLALEVALFLSGLATHWPLALPGTDSWWLWLLLLYPALGPWGLGTWLQYKAQSGQVSPSVATIILATDPLWTALFAGMLGAAEQHLGPLGLLGAACILTASLLAGRQSGH